jgi:hypothetical protein
VAIADSSEKLRLHYYDYTTGEALEVLIDATEKLPIQDYPSADCHDDDQPLTWSPRKSPCDLPGRFPVFTPRVRPVLTPHGPRGTVAVGSGRPP